jgi:hypothetical protein
MAADPAIRFAAGTAQQLAASPEDGKAAEVTLVRAGRLRLG